MKISLTVSSLSKLEKSLREAAKSISAAPDNIIDKLLDIGENVAESNIATGEAADGNEDIYVDRITVRNAGKLSMIGDDVAYQEFGYGLVGRVNRNPKQPSGYEQGQRTEWVYMDGSRKRWSHGMQARMPMYKASRTMREALPKVARSVVESAVKSLD